MNHTTTGTRDRLCNQVALAEAWRRGGDYRRAGLLLTLTLGAAETQFGRDDDLVAGVCNELGVLGKYTGRFDEAEKFYLRALRIYRTAYGEEHDAVATIYHNLGGIAHSRGRHYAGEPLAHRAVEIRTRLHGDEHPLVAADVAAWAALLAGCLRIEEAEVQLRRALRIFSQAGSEHHEIMVIAHNLAALQHRRGDLAGAAHGYTHALGLKEQLLGTDHPELAATLVNLAAVHRRLGHLDEAASHYLRAVAILSPLVEPDHPMLTAARNGLSSVWSSPRPRSVVAR